MMNSKIFEIGKNENHSILLKKIVVSHLFSKK